MELQIKNFEQGKEFPCGPNSLAMILDFFNIRKSRKEILKKFLKKTKNVGRVIIPVIAEVAIEFGLKPTLIITNYTYFPEELNKKNESEIKKYIRQKIKSKENFIDKGDREYYSSVERFIEKGGKVEFRLFTEKDIITTLIKGKPCLCQINTASFSKKDIDYRRQHFVVIKGFARNKFILNIGHKNSVEKEKEDFIFSLYRTKIPNILLF